MKVGFVHNSFNRAVELIVSAAYHLVITEAQGKLFVVVQEGGGYSSFVRDHWHEIGLVGATKVKCFDKSDVDSLPKMLCALYRLFSDSGRMQFEITAQEVKSADGANQEIKRGAALIFLQQGLDLYVCTSSPIIRELINSQLSWPRAYLPGISGATLFRLRNISKKEAITQFARVVSSLKTEQISRIF